MRWLAVLLSLSLLSGCFPNNHKHRTIAKLTEGAFVAGGIVILAVSNTQADCSAMGGIPGVRDECESGAGTASALGLGMILVGLIGFIATVSTQPDDPPSPNVPAK
jgi:hypothetical protein